MKKMTMTHEEALLLDDTLHRELSDLRMEIADTEAQEFRNELKTKERVVRSLIDKLEQILED